MARALAEEGMRLVLADVDVEQLDGAVAALSADGAEVAGIVTDVADADAGAVCSAASA